jgi:hypothetical protein
MGVPVTHGRPAARLASAARSDGGSSRSDAGNADMSVAAAITAGFEAILAPGARGAGPRGLSWKCPGATGMVQNARLLGELDAEGGHAAVIAEFDEAVNRMSTSVEQRATMQQPSGDVIMTAWRDNAPLREHRTLARASEAIIHVIALLRGGQPIAAEARLCLVLAGVDLAARDGGKWDRAQTLFALPAPPFARYPKVEDQRIDSMLSEEDRRGRKVGDLARFCSLERATVALAVFEDSQGRNVGRK